MSDYKRWISYIYYYEKNVKKNNIGYIRAETRGEMTKLTIHINVLSVTVPMNVYAIRRNTQKDIDEGIKIGTITMEKGVGHGVYSMYTSDVMNTGFGIGDIGGIIIFHENDRFYASQWDDSDIDISRFLVYGTEKNAEPEYVELTVMPEEVVTIQDELTVISEDNIVAEEAIVAEEEFVPEDNPVPENNPMTNGFELLEDDIFTEAAERMLKTFPYMYPFEEDDIDACVRIEPKDVENLPVNTWIIANNSFLLKGYYSYRHLIFFKTGKEKPYYMIGVPGINHNRDNFLANMFGFSLFRPIKKTKEIRGEFGYWCIAVESR